MFSCLQHIQKFFLGGGTKFSHIFKCIFSGKIILKHIENKEGCVGSRGVLLQKNLKRNLNTVVAILVLFEQFLSKFCLNFLPLILILSVSPNILHFVRTFSIMRALGMRLIVIEKVQNYGEMGIPQKHV